MYAYQNDSIIAFQRSHCYSYMCCICSIFQVPYEILVSSKPTKIDTRTIYLYTGIYFTYACKQGNAKTFTTKLVLIFTARDLLFWFLYLLVYILCTCMFGFFFNPVIIQCLIKTNLNMYWILEIIFIFPLKKESVVGFFYL